MQKPLRALLGLAFALGVLTWCAAGAFAAPEAGWPRTFHSGTAQVVVYQPQVKDWPNYTVLHGLAAVAVTTAGAPGPIYGMVAFEGLTNADFRTGVVTLSNTHVTSTNFPNEPAAVTTKLDGIVRGITLANNGVPLAAVLASLEGSKALPKPAPVAVAPPTIFYSQKPAILVVFDRDPIFAPIPGTGLEFAVNTNWDLIRDGPDGKIYILAGDHWLQAASFSGPWVPATAPASFAGLPDTPAWANVRKYLSAPVLAPASAPVVFASTKPADLIAVIGAPTLVAIPGTKLSYVSNTGSNVFLYAPSKTWYVLLSGRWYRSTGLGGPWTYATPSLPPDFAKIPVNSPRGGVLVSVPGTLAAQYVGASMAAPQIASVNPATTHVDIVYSGAPQFQPIAGTSLSYAVNTAYDVIRVRDDLYYACYSGIWFVAASANGPWSVASYVPQAIYGIPPTSPLYPDTYVFVYNSAGQPLYAPPPSYEPGALVFMGFTAGYLGAYWVNNAWVYGTGYYYPGFYAAGAVPIYYPYPATWTGGAVATGGSYYNSKTGYYGNQASIYGPYGGATAKSAYNPTTGTYARGGEVYGPNGEAAGGSFYNPRYGVSGTTYQEKTPYGSWGQSSVTTKSGTTYAAHQTNASGSAGAVSGPHGSTAAAKSSSTGDVYASHDGNVYRNQDGTWQKSTGGGSWSTVSTPTTSQYHPPTSTTSQYHPPSSTTSQYHPSSSSGDSSLDRDQAARTSGSSGFRGFSGGGGGGGRGRR